MPDPTPADATPFDIERPACFYLGREYDLQSKKVHADRYVMYDARDLTTHGVIVGMTGSGKTGLAITLLEEAAIDGIPCVLLDPKGDLTNLLLQFPDLAPDQFAVWLSEEDARQKGQSLADHAAQTATRWRQGLAETMQTPERIARLRAATEWRVYTPGSEAGLPLSLLGTFAAPKGPMVLEALTRKIDATATALLGLGGLSGDPVQSREHILVANLLQHAWTAGRDLDLAGLIHAIQDPPFHTVGAYNLEAFFPAKERLRFASALNNVLASPSFATWRLGEPLDLGAMLYRNGRPQQLIFSIAHLDDTQRMFFATLLLEELLTWTRKQAGTTNLRALFYFDEVFGYLPPHPANPPSKGPLLTLLKQARAFGVGILVATQNPVDLDYKALSNAGTWFVGKLQTERDKARLLEGLETVAAERGTMTDRAHLDRVIAGLGSRVFLLHSIHRPAPIVFQSRWALSFLSGPMTRDQISRLMAPVKERDRAAAPAAILLCTHCHGELGPEVTDSCPACGKSPWSNAAVRRQDQEFRDGLTRAGAPQAMPVADGANRNPPVLPPDVRQFYLPAASDRHAGADAVVYQPAVLGFAHVKFLVDRRSGREHTVAVRLLASPPLAGHPLSWSDAQPVSEALAPTFLPGAAWVGVPKCLDTGRKLKALEKIFADHLYGSQKLALFESRELELISEPGESEETFRDRCREIAEEKCQAAFDMEKAKFQPRFEALDAELPPDEPKAARGWFSWGKSKVPTDDRTLQRLKKLEADYRAKRNEHTEKWKRAGEEVTPVQIKPRKADVRVTHFGLAWVPYQRQGAESLIALHRCG